jgi:hypothetical protein
VSAAMFADLQATRPPLPQRKFRRGFGRPRVGLIIRGDDLLGVLVEESTKRGDIQPMMARREDRQVLFSQAEQPHGRLQTPAMLRMRRLLEILLQMNEGAGGLDQAFEEIRIRRIGFKPNLLQDIMRFVIALLVPALKIGAVKRMLRRLVCRKSRLRRFGYGGRVDICAEELADQL